jgi:hypothetical protein
MEEGCPKDRHHDPKTQFLPLLAVVMKSLQTAPAHRKALHLFTLA